MAQQQPEKIDWAARAREFGGTVVQAPPLPDVLQKKTPEKPSMGGYDVLAGMGKTTVQTGARLLKAIDFLSSYIVPKSDPNRPTGLEGVVEAFEPTNQAQRIGGVAGDIATALLPGGGATRLSRFAASGAPRAAAPVIRAAVDSATSAATAAAQGQDVTVPAVLGGLAGGAMGIVDDARLAARAAQGVENRMVRVGAPVGRGRDQRQAQAAMRQVAQQLAREPGMAAGSRAGLLAKVTAEMDAAADELDAVRQGVSKTRQYQTAPLIARLQDLRKEITAQGALGASSVGGDTLKTRDATLAAMQQELRDLGSATTYDELVKIRRGWALDAKNAGVFAKDAGQQAFKTDALAKGDGMTLLIDELAKGEPAMQQANSRWSFLKKAHDAMRLAEQIDQTNPRALRGVIARAGGAVAGSGSTGTVSGGLLGAIVGGAVENAMAAAPTTRIITARALARLTDALKAGKWADVETALTTLRMATQAGVQSGLDLAHGKERE